jgi:hypothetical protein
MIVPRVVVVSTKVRCRGMRGRSKLVTSVVGCSSVRGTAVRVWIYCMSVEVRENGAPMMMTWVVRGGNMAGNRSNMVSKVWGFGSISAL